jgi:Leucine-rich repeat (LRR) protein
MDVIRAPSAELFSFDNLLINMSSLGLIRPEAGYLFTNVTRLQVVTRTSISDRPETNATMRLCAVKHIIDQFDTPWPESPDKPRLISIDLELETNKYDYKLPDLTVLGPSILSRMEKICSRFYKFSDYESFLQSFTVFKTSTEDQKTVVQPWTNLNELTVCYSNLTTMDGRLFTILPNLRRLSLHHNRIQRLAENTFVHASKLEELDLSRNELWSTRDHGSTLFRGIEDSLRILRVQLSSEADLMSVAGPLGCLKKLEELDITDSRCLRNVLLKNRDTGHELIRLPSLKRLNMAGCSLEVIEPGAIEHMAGGCAGDGSTVLDIVDVSRNRLKSLHMSMPLRLLSCFENQLSFVKLDVVATKNDTALTEVENESERTVMVEDERTLSLSHEYVNAATRLEVVVSGGGEVAVRRIRIKPGAPLVLRPFATCLRELSLQLNDFSVLAGGALKCLSGLKQLDLEKDYSGDYYF